MKILFALLSAMILCSGCTVKYNLLDATDDSVGIDPALYKKEFFVDYSEVVSKEENFYLVKAPQTPRKLFAFPLKTVKLDPGAVYELHLRFAGKEKISLGILGYEYDGKNIRWNRPLLKAMSYLNVNGSTDYYKEFAISPGTEKLLPVFQLWKTGSPFSDNILLLEELSIIRKGSMKFADNALKQINLAEDYDFSRYPIGDFQKIHKGSGPNAKKWSDVQARIVEVDGEKVLNIIRSKENYIYPFITLAPFTVDPRYYIVRVTFKAKGKGSFYSGLWWQRPSLNFDYENNNECKLTDTWQTYTMVRPCMTPDVKSAALSFTSYGDGEFFIKDIEVRLE